LLRTLNVGRIERHQQHNKNADYWLARAHRFDHLRREARASETEAVVSVTAPGSVTACTASYLLQGVHMTDLNTPLPPALGNDALDAVAL